MHPSGTVSIVGRSKDMIVRGGENVYPTEVEQFIDRHPGEFRPLPIPIIPVPHLRLSCCGCADHRGAGWPLRRVGVRLDQAEERGQRHRGGDPRVVQGEGDRSEFPKKWSEN